MALRTSEAPEDDKSRIDQHYNEVLDPMEQRRQSAAREQSSGTGSRQLKNDEAKAGLASGNPGTDDGIRGQEEQGGWTTKVEPRDQPSGKQTIGGFLKANRKKGPIAAILALLVGGVLGVSLLSPSFLLIHMAEIITDKMNLQLPSMERRSVKILSKKLSGEATSGFCTSRVTVRCKFSSLNDRQLQNFEKAGIKVVTGGNRTPITGRNKPVAFVFNEKTIDAASLTENLRADPKLRGALYTAYNPKFAGFSDKVWTAVASKLRITKKPLFTPGMTDEEKTTAIKDSTRNGRTIGEPGVKYVQKDDGFYYDKDGNKVDTAIAEAHNAGVDEASKITGVDTIGETGKKTTGPILKEADEALSKPSSAAGVVGKSAGRLIGVTAIPDSVCSFYAFTKAVSYGAKTIRAVQVARYAMVFLNLASMIKAGDAKPEDVSYAADILTKTVNEEVTDENGKTVTVTSKSATDSYGYRWAAYGDTGAPSISATEFLSGGGLGGKLDGTTDAILGYIGGKGNADSFCGKVKNPWVQAGSMLAGIGLLFFGGPIGWGVLASQAVQSVAITAAISVARSVLTPMLADMVAGVLVDDTTFGEKSGDAIVSGSGVIMSKLAGAGGNAPLKPEQAVAYTNIQNEVLAQYAEQERLARSPLDPTSPHTFTGAIVSQLVPYTSQTRSFSSIFTTSFSVVRRSLSNIVTPSSFAAGNTIESYTQCEDPDYRSINLATDPFCNPIRGIPSQYLETDPIEIIDRLITSGDIDEDGKPISEGYKKFIADCIEREEPLGYTGENFDEEKSGSKCFIDDSGGLSASVKADWYVYYMDLRVLDGMENGYDTGDTLCAQTGSPPSSSAGSGTGSLGGCSSPSSGIATGGGAGLSAVWGGGGNPTLYPFGPDSDNGLYGYGVAYGLNGLQHTGSDIVLDQEAPIYSPVSGTIRCTGTGKGPGTKGGGCAAFNDYAGSGNGRVEIEMDNGYILILGHTSKGLTQVGQRVTPGVQVATVGFMNSWHVHVECRIPEPSLPAGWRIVDPKVCVGNGSISYNNGPVLSRWIPSLAYIRPKGDEW